MKIVFFGTPRFAADILTDLMQAGSQVVLAVTKPDRPKGRSGAPVTTAVKEVALARGIPVIQPEVVSTEENYKKIEAYQADLFVVVAYGEILKKPLLVMPPKGCINVHASLLPKYRGAAPIHWAVINGEHESGVTIMHMVAKMDAGDVIQTAVVPIGENMTTGELEQALCKAGSSALLQAINDLERGTAVRTPQDHTLVTYAPKIELEQCEIHWDEDALKLHNLIRGTTPYPGNFCRVTIRDEQKRIKIIKSLVVQHKKGAPGEILSFGKEGLVVACGRGALQILELQIEGKGAISADEFMRGYPVSNLRFT